MMPWWGVLIACGGFGIWSGFCFVLGAATIKTAYDKKQRTLEDTLREWEQNSGR